MRLLIDTHILIYFLEGNSSLADSHRQIIVDSENEVLLSVASLWEMAIKISIGKLSLSQPLKDVIKQIKAEDFEILPISPEHTLQVSTLPFHHHDPFDRIIIAQCQIEKLPIISNDIVFSDYSVELL